MLLLFCYCSMTFQMKRGQKYDEKTKAVTGLAALTLMAGLFSGCASDNNNTTNAAATNAGGNTGTTAEATAAPEEMPRRSSRVILQ